MRILFVYTEINIKYGIYGFQHGIASLSAYLKHHGYHNIKLCYLSYRFNPKPFRKIVSTFNPDIIGFYTTHDQMRFIEKLISEINNPNIFLLCGGPHVTINPYIIYEIPRLNAICRGEGEQPLLELTQTLENKISPVYIKNLWIRSGSEIIKNETRPFIENLDELPFVDRELFLNSKTRHRIGLTQISYQNSFRISRGCPYQCSFCSNKQLSKIQPGRFTRIRSVENILAEIKSVEKKYSSSQIYFDDDTFTLNNQFIEEFCQKYPRLFKLPFEFFARINFDTVKNLKKLWEIGGKRVSFGIESGDEKLRSQILKKTFTNGEIIHVFQEAKKIGYHTEAFLMVGFPDETQKSFQETINLIRIIQPDIYSLSIYFPFQGTDLYNYAIQKKYITPNFNLSDNFVSRRDTVLKMSDFTRKEILACAKVFGWKIYRDFSFKKAFLFWLYESKLGTPLLKYAAPWKKILRKYVINSVRNKKLIFFF